MEDTIESDMSYVISERDFVSLLIDLYRNRPVLWKIKHKEYMDKAARSIAVDQITKELQLYRPDFTAEKVRKKINIIRTNFRKEKHRVEKWRAEGRSDAKPGLWYFNELLFLDEQEYPHPRSNRVSSVTSEQDTGDLSDEASEQKYIVPEELEQSHKQTPKVRQFKNITVKRRRVEPEPEAEDQNNQEDNSECEQYMTITTTYYKKPQTREDVIAKAWAMKLKNMGADQRLFAEKIINDVLYEGQLGNLTKNGVSFCPTF